MQRNARWLLVALWLTACGGEDPVTTDTTTPTDTQVADSATDVTTPDSTVDTTVDVGPDTAPECTLNEDCEGKVELSPCETAGCINGTCVAQEGPLDYEQPCQRCHPKALVQSL